MSITTITINGTDYISYTTVAEADARIQVDPTRFPTWDALATAEKETYLVSSTNRLDLLPWAGEKAGGASQVNQWPREGVNYPDGTPTTTTDVPKEVEDACALLAGSIALDPSNSNFGTSSSNIEMVKAGSAEVQFFRPQDGPPLQDQTVYALIDIFLDGNAGNSTADGTGFGGSVGGQECSELSNPNEFDLNKGFA